MARISRKHISQTTPEFKQIKRYKAAGYVRVSSGQRYTTDSSIESQKLLIERYVDDLDDVSLVRFFEDENVSGTTFQRPAFQEMLAEIENGAIDCVFDFATLRSMVFGPAGIILILIFVVHFCQTGLQGITGLYVVDKFGLTTCQVSVVWMVVAGVLILVQGTNRKIIIENQLGDTDHDHLGKIITYASGKSAEVIIWVVKRARDEHRQAIEWLNQHTDENIGFFLLEIELWQINDSLPAPKFNVIEKPNDWAKSMKASEGLTDTQRVQLQFWQEFNNYAPTHGGFSSAFRTTNPHPQHWYDMSAGSSAYHISLTVNTREKRIGAEIYINEDKELFQHFK